MTDPGATIRLVEALRTLDDLRDWPILGPRLEAAREALLGGQGITAAEITALDEYAERWKSLRADLRTFYRVLAERDETASVALWRILHGGPPLLGWQEARLHALWTNATGVPPSIELCPRRRRV